jgi:hypothetical protein
MNERIQELAEQANIRFGRMAILDGDPRGMARFVTYSEFEKFAELIVRECAQEAYDCAKQFRNDEHYREDNLWPHFESVCNAVGDDIKIKFGVKE